MGPRCGRSRTEEARVSGLRREPERKEIARPPLFGGRRFPLRFGWKLVDGLRASAGRRPRKSRPLRGGGREGKACEQQKPPALCRDRRQGQRRWVLWMDQSGASGRIRRQSRGCWSNRVSARFNCSQYHNITISNVDYWHIMAPKQFIERAGDQRLRVLAGLRLNKAEAAFEARWKIGSDMDLPFPAGCLDACRLGMRRFGRFWCGDCGRYGLAASRSAKPGLQRCDL